MSSKSKNSSFQDFNSDKFNSSIHEFKVNLNDLKQSDASTIIRPKSCTSIGDLLIQRHKKSQAKLGAQRIRKMSLDFEDFTFVPKINRKHYKVSFPKYTKKVQEMFNAIERLETDKREEINRTLRPRDTISKPDLSNAKNLFNSRTMKQIKQEKENPLKLSLVEKTKRFWNKRQASIKKADNEKIENSLKECTFKPDLRKVIRKGGSVGSLAFKTERNFGDIAKVNNARTKENFSRQSSLSCTSSYNKISPDEQNYSFREGSNMRRLLEKSKPLLSYSITSKY